MTIIARDAVASDHLVYSWPLPIGPECEVSCSDDEQVVMCPAWMVGDRLGPGRHRWRTPDPSRPVGVFFVLTAPVEVSFDMVTSFMIPTTGMPVRLRASGSLQVRCSDPGLLIAQFVGLPFDTINDGVLRSVSRSVERMLGRLLTRRVVMSGTPMSVTDAGMLPGIVEELVAYNPTAGAVFGVELIRMGRLLIAADDGSTPYLALPTYEVDWSGSNPQIPMQNGGPTNGEHRETSRALPAPMVASAPAPLAQPRHPSAPPHQDEPKPPPQATASGEIVVKPKLAPPVVPAAAAARRAQPIEVPRSPDEITQPGVDTRKLLTPVPGVPSASGAISSSGSASVSGAISSSGSASVSGAISGSGSISGSISGPAAAPPSAEPRGAILGIGMAPIGNSAVAGEISTKIPPGGRVLVPGPNGLMQSATVRQLLQGYYELEVGSSGQTIWVPMNGVVPQ